MVGRVDAYAVLALLLGAWACTPAPADSPRDPALDDAQLADVTFVDAQQGWAVGDRGAIWHTADGGHRWQLQASTVDCRLSSVRFLDARHGWAAGGLVKPYTQVTAGVLLETRDGGEHWQLDRNLLLPALSEIKFFDAHHGWAIGQSSALFPVGVFTTDDGGRSWSALPADDGQCWLAGDFLDPTTGVVVGRTSVTGTIRRRAIESTAAEFGLRALNRVRLASPTEGWIVGDGGLVRRSADGGSSWQAPVGELPTQAKQFDFQVLAIRGQHCWVAGTPGTQVMHSADAGATWQARPTGQSLPIRAMTFVDERRGWAVGDLGLILATSDGGQTWQRQRGGPARAALAAFYGRAADVPLELIARLSTEDGYLSVVEVLNRQDLEARRGEHVDLPAAMHDAVVRVGGSSANSAWQFPVREPGLKFSAKQLIEGWDRSAEGRALDELDAYLVRQIRMWRPTLVFVPGTGPHADPQSQLIAQAVLQAVERAGEPDQRPEQIEGAGLQPWKVEKVFGSLPPGENGVVSLGTAQLSARSGRSLAELAASARGLISADFDSPPTTLGFRLLVDRLPQERGTRDFFSGIVLTPAGDARRPLVAVSDASLDRVRQTTQTRRNLQAILGQANRSDAEAGRWLAEVGQFTQSLDEASAADLLFQLAWRYYHSGRWDLAAETFEMIASRYPQHPLAGASLVWLVQYYASSEAAWRMTKTQQINARQVTAVEPQGPIGRRAQRIATASPRQTGTASPRQIGAVPPQQQVVADGGLFTGADRPETWPARASAFAKLLEKTDPTLFVEPRVRFPLAVADTRQGLTRQAERFYLSARRRRPEEAWSSCAAGEQWLATPGGKAPKQIATCTRATSKPRLDGKLDDALWQQAGALELHSPGHDDDGWSAVSMLAHDDEYLYWAASCRRASAAPAAAPKKARQRDADLSAADRIELCLDLDRDRTTFYRLSVDCRGRTHDECWHDPSWNPQWFVAVDETESTWTIEAAIPLSELARQAPATDQAWAIGLVRVAPGVGFQSWSKPAAVEPLGQGFGFLVFE